MSICHRTVLPEPTCIARNCTKIDNFRQNSQKKLRRDVDVPDHVTFLNQVTYSDNLVQTELPIERKPNQIKATFHLTISMRGQRATGKIQRNNYRHGSCGPSLTGKTMSVFLIFTQGTHRNVSRNR